MIAFAAKMQLEVGMRVSLSCGKDLLYKMRRPTLWILVEFFISQVGRRGVAGQVFKDPVEGGLRIESAIISQ